MSTTLDQTIAGISLDQSPFVAFLVQHIESLKDMTFAPFIEQLRAHPYEISVEDLRTMECVTGELEEYWKDTYGVRSFGTRISKSLDLPAIVTYESLAHSFNEQRSSVNFIWESYVDLMLGTFCVYNHSSPQLRLALQTGPHDGLIYLRTGRPKNFRGTLIGAGDVALRIAEQIAYCDLARKIVASVGSVESALSLVSQFGERSGHVIQTLDATITRKGYVCAVTDYFSNGGLLVKKLARNPIVQLRSSWTCL